jgi:hypothetical protein
MKILELRKLIKEEVEKSLTDFNALPKKFEDVEIGKEFGVFDTDCGGIVKWKKISETEAKLVSKQEKESDIKKGDEANFSKTTTVQVKESKK